MAKVQSVISADTERWWRRTALLRRHSRRALLSVTVCGSRLLAGQSWRRRSFSVDDARTPYTIDQTPVPMSTLSLLNFHKESIRRQELTLLSLHILRARRTLSGAFGRGTKWNRDYFWPQQESGAVLGDVRTGTDASRAELRLQRWMDVRSSALLRQAIAHNPSVAQTTQAPTTRPSQRRRLCPRKTNAGNQGSIAATFTRLRERIRTMSYARAALLGLVLGTSAVPFYPIAKNAVLSRKHEI